MTASAISAELAAPPVPCAEKRRLWVGRSLSGCAALFFLIDGGMKLWPPPIVLEATLQLGYPEAVIPGLGVVLLACTTLYLTPRTAILGAVLLTGYLGGAVATHVRISASWFNILFPEALGGVAWLGLWLRDSNLKRLLPISKNL